MTTTTSANTFTNFKQYADGLKRGDPDLFLGELVWFSVAEAAGIQHALLLAELTKLGIEGYIGRPPRDDDVFRRTCSAHQRKRVPTADPAVFENYLIRDVKRSGGEVVKHIVVEQVDGNNKRLKYSPAVSLTFDSKTGQITIDALSASPDDQVMNVAELIEQDFQREKGRVNSYGIRDLFRTLLGAASAANVRPGGGVYFVMSSKLDLVKALQKLATVVPSVSVDTVLLVDTTEQRKLIRRAVEAETVDEIDRTLQEIDEIMAGPEITADRYMTMGARMRVLRDRTQEYAELLDETLGNTDTRLKLLEIKMRKLYDHTK